MVTRRNAGLLRETVASLVGGAVAAGVLVTGLALGRSAIADQASPSPGLASPDRFGKGRDEVHLGDGFQLQGVPTRMSLFWTDDTSLQVADLYEERWSAAGLAVDRKVADRVMSVSAIDLDSGLMRAVTIMDTGDDRLVVPNVSSVSTLPDFSTAGAPVPLPEGLRAYTAHRSDEGTHANWVGSFVVPSRPQEIAAFYRDEFKARGYESDTKAPTSRDGAYSVEATRGPERVTVTITDVAGDRSDDDASLVFVNHARALGLVP